MKNAIFENCYEKHYNILFNLKLKVHLCKLQNNFFFIGFVIKKIDFTEKKIAL